MSNDPIPDDKLVHAIKKNVTENIKAEIEFNQEVAELERRLYAKNQSRNERIAQLIAGDCKPNETELADFKAEIPDEVTKLENFWLNSIVNSELLNEDINDDDLKILNHLTNVTCTLKGKEDPGYILDFYFSPNDFFTNEKLTKEYFVKYEPGPEEPFGYCGPDIYRVKCSPIYWKSDERNIIKKAENDDDYECFMTFFATPDIIFSEDLDDQLKDILENDFFLSDYMKEKFLPRAIYFYTGELAEDELEDDEDNESCQSDEKCEI